jgi:hypothetical protein
MSAGGRMRWTGRVNERPTISDLGLNPGRRARLFRNLFQHGPCNGTALFLPPNCSIAFWERRHGSFGENMIFPADGEDQ